MLAAMVVVQCFAILSVTGCKKSGNENIITGPETEQPIEEKPSTPIPDVLVGTWYNSDNEGPLTENWNNGTFQGQAGFREFKTMVLTKNGNNAIEYSTRVIVTGSTTEKQFYKITGTLELVAKSGSLKFHAQSGVMRIYKSDYDGYKEANIRAADINSYYSVLRNPVVNQSNMEAKRNDGANEWTVKYRKAGTENNSPKGDYSRPPANGIYVKIENRYMPTVTIGSQEWTSANFDGDGGLVITNKPQYGTFFRHSDVVKIALPQGWRLPTKADYVKLIRSQGIYFSDAYESTEGDNLTSKRLLGNLMATSGWLKQDGYANNSTGFNAYAANTRIVDGEPYGEGSNCVLWTSNKDNTDAPVAFKLIQLPSDTYAAFGGIPETYRSVYAPVRFVKDK